MLLFNGMPGRGSVHVITRQPPLLTSRRQAPIEVSARNIPSFGIPYANHLEASLFTIVSRWRERELIVQARSSVMWDIPVDKGAILKRDAYSVFVEGHRTADYPN